ncbi:GspH/FimT family pseudopilin [Rhizobacter sp. Root1221]|uniref:GspH/FimT family pseudopilin n=1 Tax=Rhizobacter sp. Root1221 TaxID=1736433 RepID=UPI0006F2CCB2|nr:GspH/FimT family pseudopilin [Rhizobacter sp. Root1221]KQW02672.1 hypothetical protein ASC87_12810 [Rhizobacter sp. Root1221]
MLRGRRPRAPDRGFTLVELMVTLSLIAILLMLAVPSFTAMLRNSQVRTIADALQNGLRQAQSEAIRRNRQTVFSLTNAEPSLSSQAVADGTNWAIHTIPRATESATVREFVQGGSLSDSSAGVTIDGPAALCFSSNGRQVAHDTPGVGTATCTVDGAQPLVGYDIARVGADRRLRVTVSLNGQVRMCDPDKTFSSSHPDGCM